MKSSNIGGQAVMEGVMMMNKDRYSVAVRRPDGEIEVKVEQHKPLTKHKGLLKVPILRGVFSFADSMIVGMSSLMYSASFYEDEEEEKKSRRRKRKRSSRKRKRKDRQADDVRNRHIFRCHRRRSLSDGAVLPVRTAAQSGSRNDTDRGGRGLCACGTVPRLSGSHFPYGRHSARVHVPRRRA